jgi:hypothetical protein
MENEIDLENYLRDLLGNENPKRKQFMTEFKKRRGKWTNGFWLFFELHD